MLVSEIVAAGGGLLFAFDHSTIAGKIVLTLLAVVSIFSWSIMITKLRVIRFARRQNARFLAAFHKDRQPLRLFEKNARFPGAPVFNVYRAGCEEMTFHLLGSAEVDDTFRARLEIADKISPAQMGAVNDAMERAVGETALALESQMILLATAVSGSPFLGLLGTVWGVMDAFTGVAGKQHEPGNSFQRRRQSADQFVASANAFDRPQRNDPVEQSGSRFGNAHRAIGPIEAGQSRRGRRDSTRSLIARAKIDCVDGLVATRANYEGRHRHKSRDEIDVERQPLLAKRHTDSTRARRTHRRINSLECRSQELFKRAKRRLARRCGRSQRSDGANNWRAAAARKT